MAKISAVILAAGAARRFGRPKQLERWPNPDSPTLVERALNTVLQSSVSEVIVVTGNQAEAVENTLQGAIKTASKPVKIVFNERWADGQGFSVAAGVQAVDPNAAAALFMLADQPRLQAATLQVVLDAFEQWSEDGAAIIFPTFNGKRGNPALFGRPFFGALAQLQGDSGGREVVKANPDAVSEVVVSDPAIHEDVDTPQDLEGLKRLV